MLLTICGKLITQIIDKHYRSPIMVFMMKKNLKMIYLDRRGISCYTKRTEQEVAL